MLQSIPRPVLAAAYGGGQHGAKHGGTGRAVVVSKPASHRHKAGGEEAKVALSH